MEDIIDKRLPNVKIFNSGLIEVYSSNVHYLNTSTNKYEEIDTSIYQVDSEDGYEYQTQYNDFKVKFHSNLSGFGTIEFNKKDGLEGKLSVTVNGLYLYDSSTKKRYIIESPNDCIIQIDNNKAIYDGVFTGVRFEYSIFPTKLKEDVILSSDIKKKIPDPISLGFNIESTYLVISTSLNSAYGIKHSDKISIIGSDGNSSSWIEEIISKSATNKLIDSFSEFNIDTNEYLFGVSFTSSQKSPYPIVIDPTISSDATTNWSYYVDGNSWTSASPFYLGYAYGQDAAKNSYYDNYENFYQFDISSLKGYTITPGSGINIPVNSGGDFDPNLQLQETTNYDSARTGIKTYKYNYGTLGGVPTRESANIGISSSTSYTLTPDVKRSVVTNKGGKVSFGIVYSGTMTDGTTSEYYITVNNSGTLTPKLVVNGYNSFVQDSPTLGGTSIKVNWTPNGGLVSGDKARVYYSQGTGLTSDQIMSSGNYIETTTYTDSSATITGLTPNASYCTVVVEYQNIGGTFYEGARSSIQQIYMGVSSVAVGDIKSSISSLNANGTLDLRPSTSGEEWVIHNVYYNQGTIELYKTDGTNLLKFDSDTTGGGRLGVVFHCTYNSWIQIKNTASTATLVAYDGIQTK